MDMADVFMLAASLFLSGCGGTLLVLIAPGWMMDRHNEHTSMHYYQSQTLGEDRTGMYQGCLSAFPAALDNLASSFRDRTWVPVVVLGLGFALSQGGAENSSDIPVWLSAITSGRFWLAVAAAIIGAVLGAMYKERKG